MNVPTADNRTPCHDDLAFIREDAAAHIYARRICKTCPFMDWCRSERDAAAALNGPQSLSGTWAGKLLGRSLRTMRTVRRLDEGVA